MPTWIDVLRTRCPCYTGWNGVSQVLMNEPVPNKSTYIARWSSQPQDPIITLLALYRKKLNEFE